MSPLLPRLVPAPPMRRTTATAKDDIVLYTYSGKAGDAGVKSMALAEKVTGKMNGFTAEKNVTVDGTTYKEERQRHLHHPRHEHQRW